MFQGVDAALGDGSLFPDRTGKSIFFHLHGYTTYPQFLLKFFFVKFGQALTKYHLVECWEARAKAGVIQPGYFFK